MSQTALLLATLTFLASASADTVADEALQKFFGELEGEGATLRDECLEKNGRNLTDLRNYDDAEAVPESDLCFYKCFYEGVGFIDEEGKVNIENLKEIPGIVADLGEEKVKELEECVEKIGKIRCCKELRKIEGCFAKVSM